MNVPNEQTVLSTDPVQASAPTPGDAPAIIEKLREELVTEPA